MGKVFNAIALAVALGVAYEMGREKGARDMFFTYTEALVEAVETKIKAKAEEVKKDA